MKVVQQVPKLRFKDESGEEFPAWKERKLRSLGATFNGLQSKTKEHFGTGVPYIQYLQVFEQSKIDLTRCGLVIVTPDERQNKVREGDIFFTVSSETPEDVGTASILLDYVDAVYLNSFCFGFRLTSSMLLSRFARYAFRENNFRRKVMRLAQGITRFNLSKTAFMKLSVRVPTKLEQEKIADFLNAIDDRIESLEQKKKLLEQYKLGLMQKLFNRKLRFKKENGEEFPEWVKCRLGEISLITKGRLIDLENKTKQGYPVIAGGKTSPYSYKFFTHENCITVSGSGAHAGHVAYHPYKFWGSDCSIVSGINSNSVTLFVYYLMFFHQRKIYSLQIGGAQPHVYPKTLKSLTLSIPPYVREQQKIAQFLTTIDDKIEQLNIQIEKTQSFKQGLLQQLFV